MAFFLLMLSLASPRLRAESPDKTTHLAVSYMLQSAFYGFSKQALGLSRGDAIAFSFFNVLMLGIAKEALDAHAAQRDWIDTGDMSANLLGQGLAVGTIIMFDF